MSDNKEHLPQEANSGTNDIQIEPANISMGIPFDIAYIKEEDDNIECELEVISNLEEEPVKIENHVEEICSEISTSRANHVTVSGPILLKTLLGVATAQMQDHNRLTISRGAVSDVTNAKCSRLRNIKPNQNTIETGSKRLTISCDVVTEVIDLTKRKRKKPSSVRTGKKVPSDFLTNRLTQGFQKCGICFINFTSRSAYEEHKKLHSIEVHNLQIKDGDSDNKTQSESRCGNCGKTFKGRQLLNLHVRICNKLSNTSGTLHADEVSPRRGSTKKKIHKIYECNECEQKFFSKQSFEGHIQVHQHDKSFACDICEQHFEENKDLVDHKAVHEC